MTLTEVAPGVWTATARLWSSISTVVVGPGGDCLVIDPGITPVEIGALARGMAARGWRPALGYSTHPHWDHMLWDPRLGEGTRWATSRATHHAADTREHVLESAAADAPGHDPALIGALTPLPDDAGELPWDGARAVVVPYPGHCPGSAALLLTDTGVLVAGDVLSDTEVPLLDLDAADPLGDYRRGLDQLTEAARTAEISVLVPGHGTVADAAELQRRAAADRGYLDALEVGRAVDDPRLSNPWIVGMHQRQVDWAARAAPR